MNLILWRHAEAHNLLPGQDDLERTLTPKGEKQAKRMAQWLDRQLPDRTRILVSPARRTEQTAAALGRKFKLRPELAPDCSVAQLLQAAEWPVVDTVVLVIGHQPTLGQTVSQLMGWSENECAVKRGAAWWLRSRVRDSQLQTVVVTVQSPELL